MLLMLQLVPYRVQLPDSSWKSMSMCHVRILDPKRKIWHPYHEDLVVLPTRNTMRVDNKSVAQEAMQVPISAR